MSEHDLERFRKLLNEEIGKRAAQAFKVIACGAFAFGCWMTKMQLNFASLADSQQEANAATKERIAEWSGWRKDKDQTDHDQDVRIARVEKNR